MSTKEQMRGSPYRGAFPEKRADVATFQCQCLDAEDEPNAVKTLAILVYVALACAVLFAGWNLGVAIVTGFGVSRFAARLAHKQSLLKLQVHAGTVYVKRPGESLIEAFSLSGLSDIEIERKSIQRVTYQQPIGAPVLTSEVSGGIEVARMVFIIGGRNPLPCSESFSVNFQCMEQFGNVRQFLRQQGWVPLNERV